ncbi:MAG TPA: UDP-N-acetylmuramate dehydrogenase [Acidimicrobiales bacterium]|nr:UDP-N-acetylmuramate dehydrogenase [Acidimicrobiales bacterium]
MSMQRAAALLADRARAGEPLGARTTYRVGGTAALLAEVGSEAGLEAIAATVAETGIAVVAVGKGSNLLVADAGFDGLAVVLAPPLDAVAVDGTEVVAGGAASLPVLARRTAAAGLTGLEWAVGVPGSVGGAVRMNAGGHGSEIRETLASVRVVDLRSTLGAIDVEAGQLALSYRHSDLSDHQVVVSGRFVLAPGDPAASEAEIDEIVRWRRANQPGGQNAGSVFTNPAGASAGALIESAGLKGHRLGSAQVSAKHANFIQADPGGSADDVLALIRHVQAVVEQRGGVRLCPEVRLVGFDPGLVDEVMS